ncbi:MAG: AtpZ/AtpI family protein [Patescibacteria group bacterium]|jgi:F0F1-type ATP synthase assembly protein I
MITDTQQQPDHFFHPVERKKKNYEIPIMAFKYSSVGIYMAIPLFLGLTSGIFLDNLFRVRPMFTLVLLFFGTVGSFYNIYRIIKENDGNRPSK